MIIFPALPAPPPGPVHHPMSKSVWLAESFTLQDLFRVILTMAEMLLVTYAEAANRLGFRSSRRVRRLVEKGLLPAVYPLQRSPRIRSADLEAYIDGLAPRVHNADCAGPAVQRGCNSTYRSANRTRMVSIDGATHRTGGSVLPTPAARELAAVLGLPRLETGASRSSHASLTPPWKQSG